MCSSDLRERLAAARILSYRVLWFEREAAGFKPKEAYPPQALACLASHDLPTFMGWRAARDIEIAQVISKAVGVKTTARSRRNSILVGALIGLIGGVIAAIAADTHARRARIA